MDPSLLDMDPTLPAASANGPNAPAGLPPLGMEAPQYVPPPSAPMAAPSPAPAPQAMTAMAAMPPPNIPDRGTLPPPMMSNPAAPSKSVTDRESTTITSRTKISPEERAAQAQLDKDATAREGVVQQQAGVNQKKADAEAEAATRKAEISRQYAPQLAKIAQSADDEINRINSRYQDAFEAARSAKPRDLWSYDDKGNKRTEDQIGKKKFWAGLAMALGGLSERDEGRNTAFDMIKSAIDRRDALEQKRIDRLYKDADEVKSEREVALSKKHEAMADAAGQKTALWDVAENELKARLAALGRSQAEIDQNADIQKIRQERDLEKAKFAEATRTEIKNQVVTKTQQIVGAGAGQANKPLDQWKPEERKAEGFAMRAWKASSDMDAYKYSPADMKVMTSAARREALAGGMTGMADKAWKLLNVSTYNQLSPEGKKRWNATKEFIISGLRPESGAAISLGELADAEQRYGTVPGDTNQTAPQKRQNRMAKIAEVGIQTGRPQFWVEQTGAYGGNAQPARPQSAPSGGDIKQVRNKRTGEVVTVRVGTDGKYYPVDQVAAR